MLDYYPDRPSLILVNFGSPGVTAAALLPGCTHRRTGATQRLPARLSGQSELGAAASTKALSPQDSHLASPLMHLLFLQVLINSQRDHHTSTGHATSRKITRNVKKTVKTVKTTKNLLHGKYEQTQLTN